MRQYKELADQVCEALKEFDGNPSNLDPLLTRLREQNLTKMECVAVLVEGVRMPLEDSIRAVHESNTWSDRKATDNQIAATISSLASRLGHRLKAGDDGDAN